MGIWNRNTRAHQDSTKAAFYEGGRYQAAEKRGCLTDVESIDVGQGNKGIYIVDYRPPAGSKNYVMPLRMIKKYSTSELEFQFSHWLYSNVNASDIYILPEVYDCFKECVDNVIILEYLPGAGTDVELSEKKAKSLAGVVHQFNNFLNERTAPNFVPRECVVTSSTLSIERLERIFKHACVDMDEMLFEYDGKIRELLVSIHPPVFSHGDLGLRNIYIQGAAEYRLRMKIIDFSHIGFMVPGAEFHHFAHRSMRGGVDKDFFDIVCATYAKKRGLQLSVVRLAAFVYALDRQIARTISHIRKREKKIPDKKVNLDLKIILRLYNESVASFKEVGPVAPASRKYHRY